MHYFSQHSLVHSHQMSSKLSSWFSILSLILTTNLLILSHAINGSIVPPDFYNTCNNTFSCGDTITEIGYPFRGTNDLAYCGHPGLVLECDPLHNHTTIEIMNVGYYVLGIYQNTQTMRIIRQDNIPLGTCSFEMDNTALDFSLFDYADSCTNFTFLYGCPDSERPGLGIPSCGNGGNGVYVVQGNQGPGNCDESVIVPVLWDQNGGGNLERMNVTEFREVLLRGFEIRWRIESRACSDCVASNGRCGFDFRTNQTTCLCPDQPFVSDTCPVGEGELPRIAPSPVPGMYHGLTATLALLHEILLLLLLWNHCY